MKPLKEGILIPVSETDISVSGHDDKDNPICHAITAYLCEQNDGLCYSAYFCLMDENITLYRKGIAGKLATLYTSTLLEDWLRAYYDHRDVLPFTLKIYHQRDDNDEIEDDRLWIGIAEDGDGVSEGSLEKLYGLLSREHIHTAQVNAVMACASGVNQDDTCPVTNVLSELTEHLNLEVTIDRQQAEFYQDETGLDIIVPFTHELIWWLDRYYTGENVREGVIYINRNDTLPDEPLFVGIDYDIGNYNVVDFDRLDGMERRLTRQHIEDSKRGDCEHCAVATVVSEMFPHYEVNVNGSEVLIHTRGTEHVALLISECLGYWIDAYDNENDVGTFTLIINALKDNEYHKYSVDIKDLTERQKDLQSRISKLSSLSADIELEGYYSDSDADKILSLEREYQDLYAETVVEFGN